VIFELSGESIFIIYCLIKLKDPISLKVHRNNLEIHIVRDKVVQELHVSRDADGHEGHQYNQLHRTDHTPESAHDKATKEIT